MSSTSNPHKNPEELPSDEQLAATHEAAMASTPDIPIGEGRKAAAAQAAARGVSYNTLMQEIDVQAHAQENENAMYELVKTIVIALVIALGIRTFAFEPFSIPSGSMMPTLLVGDYLFVSKYSYGYSQHSFPGNIVSYPGRFFYDAPERGDVAVFKKPNDEHIDYIKRIIGLPGDTVQVMQGQLFINGESVKRYLKDSFQSTGRLGQSVTFQRYLEEMPGERHHDIIEKSDDQPLDDTPAYRVPEGHLFVMGDNRDGSQDSRVMDIVGFVPVENLVGRAEFLFFSVEEGAAPWQFWRWPWTIRWERLFTKIV